MFSFWLAKVLWTIVFLYLLWRRAWKWRGIFDLVCAIWKRCLQGTQNTKEIPHRETQMPGIVCGIQFMFWASNLHKETLFYWVTCSIVSLDSKTVTIKEKGTNNTPDQSTLLLQINSFAFVFYFLGQYSSKTCMYSITVFTFLLRKIHTYMYMNSFIKSLIYEIRQLHVSVQ